MADKPKKVTRKPRGEQSVKKPAAPQKPIAGDNADANK